MKRVLVIGAAGMIGVEVIKNLLIEGKYDITALELKNEKTKSSLKKYKKRITTIYGDLLDRSLVENLIKTQDYIIYLAGVNPPYSFYKKDFLKLMEVDTVESVLRAINYYNPSCKLIYASSTSIYKDKNTCTIKSKLNNDKKSYSSFYKINAEKLIMEKISNYQIVRLPIVLGDVDKGGFIYNIDKTNKISSITKEDAAYLLVNILSEDIDNKVINIAGNDTFDILYEDLLYKVIEKNGISIKMILNNLFIPNYYTSPQCLDKYDGLEYQNDTLNKYINRLNKKNKKIIRRFIGRQYIRICQRKK